MKTITNNDGHSYLADFVKCSNCSLMSFDYVDEINPNYRGKVYHCRKYAPRLLYGSGEGYSSQMFPVIRDPETFWCGDFQTE